MQELTLFYLEHCPYCKRARGFMEDLKNENPAYADIPVRMIEESMERTLAEQYDYYYVPSFYLDGQKISEGAVDKDDVQAVLDKALNA